MSLQPIVPFEGDSARIKQRAGCSQRKALELGVAPHADRHVEWGGALARLRHRGARVQQRLQSIQPAWHGTGMCAG